MQQHQHLSGLTDEQVLKSRQEHGVNILTPPEKDPLWKQYLFKFKDPLIIILLIAGFLSIGISIYEYKVLSQGFGVFFEPIGIFIAILLATGLAFIFEYQADKEFEVLNRVNDDEPVDVIRNDNTTSIPKKDVVVGDIVILNTGAEVPADGILHKAVHLQIDESTLTGESEPRHKTINEAEFEADATYPSNRVLRGTQVMEGHGVFEVTEVGDKTENGKVYQAVQIDDTVKTPLNEQLDRLANWITVASYIIAAVIIVARIVLFLIHNEGIDAVYIIAYSLQTLMIAVTLIVVAVPEGLPMAVTLSLAYSMRSMFKTNNLVRKMHACETMGATTVICTDKTGTLTKNQMKVEDALFYDLKDQNYDNEIGKLIREGVAINSTAELDLSDPHKPMILGNPTEGALLLWLREKGDDYQLMRDRATMIEELQFTTERKYMASIVTSAVNGKKMLYVKGAPEIVMALCKSISANTPKETIEKQLLDYQSRAMRTLGFACQELKDGDVAIRDNKVVAENMTFLGIVAISDPIRDDVKEAIEESMKAGIEVKIVTGDTPGIAREIARQIGLLKETDNNDCVITGPEFAALSDTEAKERIKKLKLIARARPMDKQKLVQALQANNHVVAVTGDGTNDAPALKAAHVGISMGDGTAVAKGASDITIIDNSFASINRAVMWGRSLYQNIQRFLLFQLTVNVSACLIVLAGAFMGTQSPLTVTQMLWVNLIMDTFGAMALASLPPSKRVMKAKPRDRNAFILSSEMAGEIFGVGFVFFLILLGFLYIFEHADITCMRDLLTCEIGERNMVTPYEQTLLFSIFVWTHFFYMFNARSFYSAKSIFQLKLSGGFVTIATVIIVGQLLIVEVLYSFFNVTPMFHSLTGLEDWIIIVVGSSFVLWIRELWSCLKRVMRK